VASGYAGSDCIELYLEVFSKKKKIVLRGPIVLFLSNRIIAAFLCYYHNPSNVFNFQLTIWDMDEIALPFC
jgi:hypothetical protein